MIEQKLFKRKKRTPKNYKNDSHHKVCEWYDLCTELDNNNRTQRVFYCLKAISESTQNIHWKKRATYTIKPHIDRWDMYEYKLNFSNPLYRIEELNVNCKRRNSIDKIAIPFSYYKKPLDNIKKQVLQVNHETQPFDIPSRLESAYAYSLFLSKKVNIIQRMLAQFENHQIVSKQDVYYFIASLFASMKSDDKDRICNKTIIEEIMNGYFTEEIDYNYGSLGKLNGINNKWSNLPSFKIDIRIIIYIIFRQKKINKYLMFKNLNLFTDTIQRLISSYDNKEVSLFPIHAIKNFIYYNRSFSPKSKKKPQESDSEVINKFVLISAAYQTYMLDSLDRFKKLNICFLNHEIYRKRVDEAINLNFFLDLIDSFFPAIIPLPQNIEDGNITVELLNNSNITYYFRKPNKIEERLKKEYEEEAEDEDNRDEYLFSKIRKKTNLIFLLFRLILFPQSYITKFLKIYNFNWLLSKLMYPFTRIIKKYFVIIHTKLVETFLKYPEFTYLISLESAESIHIKFEVNDIGYRIKEPKELKAFFNRYKWEDNYLHLSTRKNSPLPPYINNTHKAIPDLVQSFYEINIRYTLGRALNLFLIVLSALSSSMIFIKGDVISYTLGGMVPVILLVVSIFSIGEWSLTHKLIKPYKILFAIIPIFLVLKILFIILGRHYPDIVNTSLYNWGMLLFYNKL